MKKISLISFILITAISFSQTVSIPDPNFEQALIDLNIDNSSPTDEIDGFLNITPAVTGRSSLNVSSKGITDLTGIDQFSSLEILSCENNSITTADFSNNQLLRNLFIWNNNLDSLDLNQNSNLEVLWCQSNEITQLLLPTSSVLNSLECQFNNLSTINLSNSTALEKLKIQNNSITDLDLSSLVLLEDLDAFDNGLETINLENCVSLQKMSLRNNNLTQLEIEDKPSLYRMLLQFNDLTSLSVKNVDYDNFNFNLNLQGNTNLSCVEVTDPDYSNANWGWLSLVTYSSDCSSNSVNIPDPNFEQVLIDEGIDSDGIINGQILDSDALGVTSLIMNNANISDLTGIEAFTDLEILTAVNNNLTSISLSQNPALSSLILIQNNLTAIDVSNNLNLSTLNLTANNLSSIDLSNNNAIIILDLTGNNLSNLNTSNLSNLSEFRLQNNSLTALDFSQNPNLIQIACASNNLTELNVQNGNNTNINNTFFDATNNPNLTCIQVDDVTYSNSTWTSIDVQTSFAVDCNANFINIPDSNFEQALIDLNIDTDGIVNGQMLESAALGVTTLDVNSENISDLAGIEFFTDLETLFAFNNNLSSIDISANISLGGLVLSLNNLTNIDVSNNPNLVSLVLGNNQLTSLDLSNNTALTQVFVENNNLTEIDTGVLPLLAELNVSANTLEVLDLSQNGALNQLLCSNNNLISLNLQNGNNLAIDNVSFNASANPNLFCIQVDDINYSDSTWTNLDAQSFFGLDCAPDNDACFEATSITLGQDTPGTTESATPSGFNPACQQEDIVVFDVWYQFIAPDSGSITMTLSAGSLVAKAAVYENCNNTVPLACAEGELQLNDLTAGQTYNIQVWLELSIGGRNTTSALNAVGSFVLNVEDTASLSVGNVENESHHFQMFPNPANDKVNIKTVNPIKAIHVFDAIGKRIMENQNINAPNFVLNATKLPNGIYFVQVTTDRAVLTQKLIIK